MMRIGFVTAAPASGRVLVRLNGNTHPTPCRYLTGLTLTTGTKVAVSTEDTFHLVIGAIA